ncbi:MAG TPA: GlsB/YeaQ/YmgE family stress response membrane protein [Caulobacteraceae bacterium]
MLLHIVVYLITGLVAGVIADNLMGRRHGWVVAMIIGVIGGIIGGWLANHFHLAAKLHLPANGTMHWLVEVVIAVAGAVILLFVLGLFRRRGP